MFPRMSAEEAFDRFDADAYDAAMQELADYADEVFGRWYENEYYDDTFLLTV